MWELRKIVTVSSKDDQVHDFDGCRWMKNYESMD